MVFILKNNGELLLKKYNEHESGGEFLSYSAEPGIVMYSCGCCSDNKWSSGDKDIYYYCIFHCSWLTRWYRKSKIYLKNLRRNKRWNGF